MAEPAKRGIEGKTSILTRCPRLAEASMDTRAESVSISRTFAEAGPHRIDGEPYASFVCDDD
jgi:hypothetical protein